MILSAFGSLSLLSVASFFNVLVAKYGTAAVPYVTMF